MSQPGRYPTDWRAISNRIRFERAGGKCECTAQCGSTHLDDDDKPASCGAPHGQWIVRCRIDPEMWEPMPRPLSRGMKPVKVVLAVAHLDHTPENCSEDNLVAMCQRCHLMHDRYLHAYNAAETRRRKKAQNPQPSDEE